MLYDIYIYPNLENNRKLFDPNGLQNFGQVKNILDSALVITIIIIIINVGFFFV